MPAKTVKKAIHVAVPVHESEPVPKPMPHVEPIAEPTPIVAPEPVLEATSQEDQSVVEAPVENEVVVEPQASDMPSTIEPNVEEEAPSEKQGQSLRWLIVVIAFIFGVVVGGAGIHFATYYLDGKIHLPSTAAATPTPEPTSASVPTPTTPVEPTRSDLKVKVLNGSGKAGAAATVKTQLETLGYVVTETDNADKTDYEKTTVSVRTEKKALGEMLVSDLKKTFTVEDLKETSDLDAGVDAVVIVGKK